MLEGPAARILKVLDGKKVGFADFRNGQYVSVGNVAAHAALMLMDHP